MTRECFPPRGAKERGDSRCAVTGWPAVQLLPNERCPASRRPRIFGHSPLIAYGLLNPSIGMLAFI
jgi:hypothetical protein